MPQSNKSPENFKRVTITLPGPLFDWATKRAAEPRYAANLSAFVRALIVDDQERKVEPAGATVQ